MKSNLLHSKVQLEPAILKHLVSEVKETVATNINAPHKRKRSFGATQLWAITGRRRYAAHMRRLPEIIVH